MTRHPRVSVLMLTYNRPQKIGRAIASVCAQTYQDWELLVVQDGSNAETMQTLREWTARDPRIQHLRRGVIGCIAEASNYGLRQAQGEYIAILDDDDYWSLPEKLARQVEFLDRNPEYVGCGGGYIVIDESGRQRATVMKPEKDAGIRSGALLANPIGNSTAVFRRCVHGEPALYDESLRGFADWEFWLKMGSLGKLYNFPESFAHYALWQGGGSFAQHRVNTLASIRIVRRYRNEYRWYMPALGLAYVQLLYASLPLPFRRSSFTWLSSLKKALTSAH